jgi:hypothetical protein
MHHVQRLIGKIGSGADRLPLQALLPLDLNRGKVRDPTHFHASRQRSAPADKAFELPGTLCIDDVRAH